MGCAIIGCGKALPALEVTNDDLTALVDTSDEWITTRTGIKTRRICVDETNVDLAEAAARRALGWEPGDYNERRIDPEEIDLVIFLRDPLTPKSHEPDVNNVVKLCDTHNIPLATNLATAELLIRALDRGDLEWREMYK